MDLSVVGISHHTACVEAREAFALPGDLAARLLQTLRADERIDEVLVLDTCNRTEVYLVTKKCPDPVEFLLTEITALKNQPPVTDRSAIYCHQGAGAVQHLFRVSAALDSQIVGEHQILGQVKNAFRLACDHRTTQLLLNKLLHRAFRVGKRAQTETALGQGSASVAQAAVTLARQVFSSLEGKAAMLVGVGETGTLAAKALIRGGVRKVVVANRTLAKAGEVASEIVRFNPEDADLLDLAPGTVTCPALKHLIQHFQQDHPLPGAKIETRAIGLDDIPEAIAGVDLVISSTAAPDTVLTAEALRKPIRASGRPLVMIDIAVPRDIDADLAKLDNVFLYNLDDLDRIVAQNIASREAEVPRVEGIVADELQQFLQWYQSLQITPIITLLQQRFAMTQAAEVKKFQPKVSDADAEQLAQLARSLSNKIVHQPIAYLRRLSEEAGPSETLAAAQTIRQMFALDELEEHDS